MCSFDVTVPACVRLEQQCKAAIHTQLSILLHILADLQTNVFLKTSMRAGKKGLAIYISTG